MAGTCRELDVEGTPNLEGLVNSKANINYSKSMSKWKARCSNFQRQRNDKMDDKTLFYNTTSNHLPASPLSPSIITQSPRSQRQRLNSHNGRFNKPPKRDCTHNNAYHIRNIIPIRRNIAEAAAIVTAMFICLECTGKGLSNEIPFQRSRFGNRFRRFTRCHSEHVDEFEDEEAGECTA